MNKDQFIQACISAMEALIGATYIESRKTYKQVAEEFVSMAVALEAEIDRRIIVPI